MARYLLNGTYKVAYDALHDPREWNYLSTQSREKYRRLRSFSENNEAIKAMKVLELHLKDRLTKRGRKAAAALVMAAAQNTNHGSSQNAASNSAVADRFGSFFNANDNPFNKLPLLQQTQNTLGNILASNASQQISQPSAQFASSNSGRKSKHPRRIDQLFANGGNSASASATATGSSTSFGNESPSSTSSSPQPAQQNLNNALRMHAQQNAASSSSSSDLQSILARTKLGLAQAGFNGNSNAANVLTRTLMNLPQNNSQMQNAAMNRELLGRALQLQMVNALAGASTQSNSSNRNTTSNSAAFSSLISQRGNLNPKKLSDHFIASPVALGLSFPDYRKQCLPQVTDEVIRRY